MTMIRPRSDVVYGIYRGLPSAEAWWGTNRPRLAEWWWRYRNLSRFDEWVVSVSKVKVTRALQTTSTFDGFLDYSRSWIHNGRYVRISFYLFVEYIRCPLWLDFPIWLDFYKNRNLMFLADGTRVNGRQFLNLPTFFFCCQKVKFWKIFLFHSVEFPKLENVRSCFFNRFLSNKYTDVYARSASLVRALD